MRLETVVISGVIALIALLVIISVATAAAPQCAMHGKVMNALVEKYNETPRANGTVNANNIMETYVSEKGSWTIVITRMDGWSCIMVAGQDYEILEQPSGDRALRRE